GLVATTDSTGKFSFTNLRPGRHAFRLDPRSIPDGYRLATDGLELVDASGWTTPRVEFRLVPSGAARVDATRPPPTPGAPPAAPPAPPPPPARPPAGPVAGGPPPALRFPAPAPPVPGAARRPIVPQVPTAGP